MAIGKSSSRFSGLPIVVGLLALFVADSRLTPAPAQPGR
jgi:hypothetical protein